MDFCVFIILFVSYVYGEEHALSADSGGLCKLSIDSSDDAGSSDALGRYRSDAGMALENQRDESKLLMLHVGALYVFTCWFWCEANTGCASYRFTVSVYRFLLFTATLMSD